MKRSRTIRILFAAALLVSVLGVDNARADARLWSMLRSGEAIAVMRHALAPGTGDPANFRIGDCTTQRNLNERGRDQARAIGAAFKRNGITVAEVLTSQWCRCRETAELLSLGEPRDLSVINSFFQDMERRDAQTTELKLWLQANPHSGSRVLVTHQVNVSALTGRFTRSGEIIVATLRDDGTVRVHGSLLPN